MEETQKNSDLDNEIKSDNMLDKVSKENPEDEHLDKSRQANVHRSSSRNQSNNLDYKKQMPWLD